MESRTGIPCVLEKAPPPPPTQNVTSFTASAEFDNLVKNPLFMTVLKIIAALLLAYIAFQLFLSLL